MTLADLKRKLVPGTKLRLVYSIRHGACNKARTVKTLRTNGVSYIGEDIPEGEESWMSFPKAKDLVEIEGGFSVKSPQGVALVQYIFEE